MQASPCPLCSKRTPHCHSHSLEASSAKFLDHWQRTQPRSKSNHRNVCLPGKPPDEPQLSWFFSIFSHSTGVRTSHTCKLFVVSWEVTIPLALIHLIPETRQDTMPGTHRENATQASRPAPTAFQHLGGLFLTPAHNQLPYNICWVTTAQPFAIYAHKDHVCTLFANQIENASLPAGEVPGRIQNCIFPMWAAANLAL